MPTLVINGDRDPFGLPEPDGLIRVAVRLGERHDLRRDPAAVGQTAVEWLRELLSLPRTRARRAIPPERGERQRHGPTGAA
jgi:hypothetical protein